MRRTRKKRTLFLKNKYFWFAFLFIVVVCALSYFLFVSSFFKIKKVNFVLPADIDKKPIEEIVESNLNEVLFKSNYFLFNASETEKEIENQFLKIKQVKIARSFPNSLNVNVFERAPVLVFCVEECFLMDDERIAFEKGEREGLPKVFSSEELTEREMEVILEVFNFFNQKLEIEIKDFVKDDYLTLNTVEEWKALFDFNSDIKLSLTKLRLLLEQELSEREDLEYIDLRFSKVYYK